jgi:hypothetical protein
MKRHLRLLGLVCLTTICFQASAEEVEIHIRVINGKNARPIADEQLNVWRNVGQKGSEIFPTNKNGIITLRIDRSASIEVESNIYVTCHPYRVGDARRFYSVDKIVSEGLTDSNMCGKTRVFAMPGELIFFERPRTLWEWLKL